MYSSNDDKGQLVFIKALPRYANEREAPDEISMFAEQKTEYEWSNLEMKERTMRILRKYEREWHHLKQESNPKPKELEPEVSHLRETPAAKSHGGNETQRHQEERLRYRFVNEPITSRKKLHHRQTQQTSMRTSRLREHPVAKSHGGNETQRQQEERYRYRFVNEPITSRQQLHDRQKQQRPVCTSHETQRQQEEALRDRCVSDPITIGEQLYYRQTLMPTNEDIEAKKIELLAERRTERINNADFLMKNEKVDRIWMENQRGKQIIEEKLMEKKMKKRDKKIRKKIKKTDKKEKKKRRKQAKKEKKRKKKEEKWKKNRKGELNFKQEKMAEMEEELRKLWEMPDSDSMEWESMRRELFFIRWVRYMRFVASVNTEENRWKKWWRKMRNRKARREEKKQENREKKRKMRLEKKFLLEEEIEQIEELSNPGDEEWELTKTYFLNERRMEYINYVAFVTEKEEKEREKQKREKNKKNNPSWIQRLFGSCT